MPAGGLRERIARQFEAARERTLALVETLPDDELTRQVSPIMSPLVWDLAHIGYFEELWVCRRLGGGEMLHPQADDLYDAFAHPRDERPSLGLLDPDTTRQYLAEVRGRSLEVLETVEFDTDDRLLEDGFVFGLVLQHELQHIETMLQTIQLSGVEHDGGRPSACSGTGDVLVAGGSFSMGADGEPWAYDNEAPAHAVDVAPFRIDEEPVTNRAYAEFLADGGWPEPPLSWRLHGEASWSRIRFGQEEEVPPDEPVQHVSWDEAAAFAAWSGARLPAEAEWEKAATAGVLGNVGSVWEWTSSDFTGYPGFRAFPYPEYSKVFFGSDYKVLRGGSWATDPIVARVTFRNWDLPVRRQLFAGFRCARDA